MINFTQWAERPAIRFEHRQFTYQEVMHEVQVRMHWLKSIKARTVALLADNTPDWVFFDLACQYADIILIPVPLFFTPEQRRYLLASSGCDTLLSDIPLSAPSFTDSESPFDGIYVQRHACPAPAQIPQGTSKITFTSGTTGTPKGVCLTTDVQYKVASSLVSTLRFEQVQHACILPLATLLENIAGVYAPLMAGGCIWLSRATTRGFSGARLSAPDKLPALLSQLQPETLILVPELLMLLLGAIRQGWQAPSSLSFIAVGGAMIAPGLLQQAQLAGLPVYQGYGLSECVSVTTLNTPSDNRFTSVGKPLSHNQVSVDNDELVMRGTLFSGYLNEPETFYPREVRSRDLGHIDDAGFIHISGRASNIIVNSYGRNISPEWVEARLLASGLFAQVLVFGEGQPELSALLASRHPETGDDSVQKTVNQINGELPEYARIGHYHQVPALATTSELLTSNGKVRRKVALQYFSHLTQPLTAVAQ